MPASSTDRFSSPPQLWRVPRGLEPGAALSARRAALEAAGEPAASLRVLAFGPSAPHALLGAQPWDEWARGELAAAGVALPAGLVGADGARYFLARLSEPWRLAPAWRSRAPGLASQQLAQLARGFAAALTSGLAPDARRERLHAAARAGVLPLGGELAECLEAWTAALSADWGPEGAGGRGAWDAAALAWAIAERPEWRAHLKARAAAVRHWWLLDVERMPPVLAPFFAELAAGASSALATLGAEAASPFPGWEEASGPIAASPLEAQAAAFERLARGEAASLPARSGDRLVVAEPAPDRLAMWRRALADVERARKLGTPLSAIVLVAPRVDAFLRFELEAAAAAWGVPAHVGAARRSLVELSAVRRFLALACWAHPAWGAPPPPDECRRLARWLAGASPEHAPGEPAWFARASASPEGFFRQALAAAPPLAADEAEGVRQLIAAASSFAVWAPASEEPLGRRFVGFVRSGLLRERRRPRADGALCLYSAARYAESGPRARLQFWLDVGSPDWQRPMENALVPDWLWRGDGRAPAAREAHEPWQLGSLAAAALRRCDGGVRAYAGGPGDAEGLLATWLARLVQPAFAGLDGAAGGRR